MIKNEIDKFVKDKLPHFIRSETEKRFLSMIKDYLLSPEFNERFDNRGNEVQSEAVKQIMILIAPELLSALFGGVIQQAINSIRYSLPDYR